MEKDSPPSLLPVLRSRQQAQILTALLGDPSTEASLTDLGTRLGIPVPSVHREIERAEAAGLVTSRRVGNTRLVRADTTSPYFAGLADVLVKAFGPPRAIAEALSAVDGIQGAYIFGSWAARDAGVAGERPIGDIDLLVLGTPDRDELYRAIADVESLLGRPVQVTVRDEDWLKAGSDNFHATVTGRPLVRLDLTGPRTRSADPPG